MEKRKREWTNENEEASLAGVKKHGFGNPNSLSDSQLASSLANQSKRKRECTNEDPSSTSIPSMASSSSSGHNKSYLYDVFLSFSGEDTRKTFVDHLYAALDQHGICTFKDDERLEKGKNIKDDLLQSIEESRLYIIVLSKSYAASSWCLNELLKIMDCHKTNEHTAFPVFYDVDPSEVRKQSGSVGEALAKHKNKTKSEVDKWREALMEAANLSGWDVKNIADGHEAKVIKIIVEKVSLELRSINIDTDENFVGMEQRMQDLDSSLDIGSNDVRMIGIKGMGGAGKTTLARAIFNRISFNFEGKSFVENVRENSKPSLLGMKKLQEQILRDVLKDGTITVSSVHEGTHLIKTMFHGKRILVVLDDVDREDQLEELAGDPSWFKSGSRIIITTRDLHVLNTYTVKWIHDVNLLTDEEAIHLFCRHAFKKNSPTQEYERQSHEVVSYAGGLPLTIKVLGSHLRGRKKCEWKDAIARLKTIPLKETLKILELSYEGLEDDYKDIFLDVACFLRHMYKDEAIIALESCGFHAINGLRVLEEKSLIKTIGTYEGGNIHMHDHIVEMGENIVRREHPDEPEKHSRLWVEEEIEHVLANGLVNEDTRCIDLEYFTNDFVWEGFKNMKRLRCFIARGYFHHDHFKRDENPYFPNSLRYIHCFGYPYWYLPNTFEAHNLVGLNMTSSKIKHFWEGGKVMKKLKFLNLSYSRELRSLDLGLTPNLERLKLTCCFNLDDIYLHGGCLKSLIYLNLQGCLSLKSLLFIEQLESLEVLYINELNLSESPDYIITWHSNNTLLHLHLSNSDNIPASIGNLHNLVSLVFDSCCLLKSLPGSICSLQHLKTLKLDYTNMEELPEDIGQLECLENLYLSSSKLKHLPPSICMLKRLKTLRLMYCYYLEKLPEDIGHLESLVELNLQGCKELRDIPNSICKLKHLKELTLEGCCGLEELPDNLGDLKCLQMLNIQDTWITHIPHSIYLLKGLKIFDDGFTRLFSKYDSQKHQIQIFQHLKTLDLGRCYHIEKFPEALGQLESLEELNLSHADVKHLPDSICMLKHLKKLVLRRCVLLDKLPDDVGQLESLEVLDLSRCYNMREIPDSVCMMKQLKILRLWHCFCLKKLPEDVGQLESLEELYITRSYNIREIPSSICMLKHLKKLELEGCVLLEKLPEDVGQLKSLEVLDLASCDSIKEIPNCIGMLKHLKKLVLNGCMKLEKLPDKLGDLKCLQELTIWDTGITHLPQSISLLNGLKIYQNPDEPSYKEPSEDELLSDDSYTSYESS